MHERPQKQATLPMGVLLTMKRNFCLPSLPFPVVQSPHGQTDFEVLRGGALLKGILIFCCGLAQFPICGLKVDNQWLDFDFFWMVACYDRG